MIGLILLGAVGGAFVGAVVDAVLAVRAGETEEPCPMCGRYFSCEVGPRKLGGRCATHEKRWFTTG